jgi:hypothetical protein
MEKPMSENLMKYTYNKLIPLQLQIWLATNTYKTSPDPKTLSATAFLKSIKSLILSGRAQDMVDEAVSNGDFSALQALNKPDLLGLLKSRMGTAIHDSAENAWIKNYRQAFKDLGYTDTYIDRIVINPEPSDEIPDDAIVVYTEKRLEREIGGYTVSGEADFIFNGVIQDLKTTSVYAFQYADDAKHTMQMSIYKWIFEAHGIKIDDMAQVNYLFTDWSKIKADTDKTGKYPPLATVGVEVALNDTNEVENFLLHKISMIEEHTDSPEEDIPNCTPEEVWQRQSKWAYYQDPNKIGGRASRVFDSYDEAVIHKNTKNVGVIMERPGQVTFCNFCAGASLCKQKDDYINAGLLEYTG